jgi:SpoVK/Ycf46/Vps4 family AAA+-type ATPase
MLALALGDVEDKNWNDRNLEFSHFIHEFYSLPNSTKKKIGSELLTALRDHADQLEEETADSELGQKFQSLADTLELTAVETEIVRLLLAMDYSDELKDYLEDIKVFNLANQPLLSRILKASIPEISKSLRGKLKFMGIISEEVNTSPMLECMFYQLLESSGNFDSLESFVPAREPLLAESDFFAPPETINMLKRLFQNPSPDPTHVLLYGPAGVGKTQFARTLAAAAKVSAYEVLPEERKDSHRSNLILANAFVRRETRSMLIIDEADELLNAGGRSPAMICGLTGRENNKSWIDDFLEKPNSKCLWIVNNPKYLPDSVVRRFAFSLGFPDLGRREREKIWLTSRTELTNSGSGMLSDAAIANFAKESQVSPGVINLSFRMGLAAEPENETTLISYVNKMITAHQTLAGSPSAAPSPPEAYRPESLNLRPTAEEILKLLRNYLAESRETPEYRRQGIKFLFHGLPGTGKTELANYLAESLEIELVHGRLSEILSPFVGESENRLTNLFEKARALGGLLMIDEIESFLVTRNHRHNHHLTMLTNEFLICLERFRGIFIGSTNRFFSLDRAAIRRFTFKVEFKPLGPEGRLALFESYFRPLSESELTEAEKLHLLSLPSLTPGDFATVAAKAKWLMGEGRENLALLESLALEASYREDERSRYQDSHAEERDPREEPSKPPRSIN